jgi:hypothetical protein
LFSGMGMAMHSRQQLHRVTYIMKPLIVKKQNHSTKSCHASLLGVPFKQTLPKKAIQLYSLYCAVTNFGTCIIS